MRDEGRDESTTSTDTLSQAVLGPHNTIDHLARSAHPDHAPAEPRDALEVIDAFMSVISRHLAAVEDVVLPAAKARLDDGHDRVTTYLHEARDLEQYVHLLKARTYGDVHAHDMHPADIWAEIEERFARHEQLETELVRDLVGLLPTGECDAMAGRVLAAGDHAPTRPHPMTPHTGKLGRITHRMWRVADSFWDTAEGRVIPHRRKPPHPRNRSLLTPYMMGSPTFDESEPSKPGER